jgi:hypothetical protein
MDLVTVAEENEIRCQEFLTTLRQNFKESSDEQGNEDNQQ